MSESIDHRSARKRACRLAALFVVLGVIATIGGFVLAAVLRNHHGDHHSSGILGALAAVAIVAVVFAAAVPVMLRVYRRPAYARVLQFPFGQRRRVGKALRKGTALAPEDRPVADALIRTMRQQRWVVWVFGVLIALNLARAIFDDGLQRWLGVALTSLYVVFTPWLVWQRRRMLANYDRLISQSH